MEDNRTSDDLVAASDHLELPEDPGVKGLIDNWEKWDIVNRGHQMHSHLPPSFVLLRKIDENEELTVSTEQSTRYESDPWVSDWSVGSTEIVLTGETPFEKIQLPEKRRRVSPSLGLRALSISTRSTASDSSSQGSETENAMIPDYDVVLGCGCISVLGACVNVFACATWLLTFALYLCLTVTRIHQLWGQSSGDRYVNSSQRTLFLTNNSSS